MTGARGPGRRRLRPVTLQGMLGRSLGRRVTSSLLHRDGVWVRLHRVGTAPVDPALPHGLPGAPAPAFLLLHGIGASGRYFRPLAEELSRHGVVHVLDLPGFAGLPDPPRRLSVPDFAAVVDGVLRAGGVRDPVLVGHSMGTQVAVELLAGHAGYSRAVLVGPVVDASARSVAAQLLRFARTTAHEPVRVSVAVAASYVRAGAPWYLAVLPEMMRYRIEDRLAHVAGAVTLLRGDNDAVAPASWVESLAAVPTRAGGPPRTARTVPGGAHAVMYSRPAEVAAAAVALARPPADAPAPAPVGTQGRAGAAR
ncbi:alpha/beta fold hydrolase [Georgenia sp. AZ-5]|uniref:alpha/beta fold hydrolase n=1 Tax=Georgenia sp. AZ-5 TaxID=3367526 RepID=UPI0037540A98